MSRIRTIKPEFHVSEQVISCSPLARFMFIGLWNFCDDAGIHPASYVRLKAEVFPADNFSIEQIREWVAELIANGLLREYVVETKNYWMVTGWKNHQKIDKPTYRHPLPQSELKLINNESMNNNRNLANNPAISQQHIGDHSTSNRRIVCEYSIPESNGMESKGINICEVKTSPCDVNKNSANTVFDNCNSCINTFESYLSDSYEHN